MATSTKTKPTETATGFGDTIAGVEVDLWQRQIIDQLADVDPDDYAFVVYSRQGERATMISTFPNETDAITAAAACAALPGQANADEVAVVAADELHRFIDGEVAAREAETARETLFAAEQYDDPELALDKVDEKDVDKIRIEFSGSVMLDRRAAGDVALIRSLKLGKALELRVAATCNSKKTGYTTGKEGDLDAIVFTGGLKVDTLYVLTPEELV